MNLEAGMEQVRDWRSKSPISRLNSAICWDSIGLVLPQIASGEFLKIKIKKCSIVKRRKCPIAPIC